MAVPTWRVLYAPRSSPLLPAAQQTWEDITGRVKVTGRGGSPITITHGRSEEVEAISPNTCTLVLDNSDGYLTTVDPDYDRTELGIYLRVIGYTDSGGVYYRFTGQIHGWEIADWGQYPYEKTISVTASDRLAHLQNRARKLRSMVEQETLATNPNAYYPLAEASEATSAVNVAKVAETSLVPLQTNSGEFVFAGSPGVPTDILSAPKWTEQENSAGWVTLTGAPVTQAYPYGGGNNERLTISCWVNVEKMPTVANAVVFNIGDNVFQFKLELTTAGMWRAFLSDLPVVSSASVEGGPATTGQFYHLVAVASQGSPLELYVNGALLTGDTCPTLDKTVSKIEVGYRFTGSVSGVGIWRRPLTQTEVSTIYRAGSSGTAGLVSDQAISLVLGYCGIGPDQIDLRPAQSGPVWIIGESLLGTSTVLGSDSFGSERVGNVPMAGRRPGEVLAEFEQTEGGLLFVDTAGMWRFHPRAARYNPGTPVVSFGVQDVNGALSMKKNDSQPFINDVTVARRGGASYRLTNEASRLRRGDAEQSFEHPFYTDAGAESRAGYLINAYSTPRYRCPQVPVDITTSDRPDDFLEREISDLTSFTDLSSDAPPLGEQWLEGWTESIAAMWTVTFHVSPVLFGDFWVLDDPVRSVLGTSTVLAY